MPFDIPDNDVAFHTNQSIWMSADIDILAVGFNGVGVVDGCAVTAQGSPDMTVAIAAGNIRIASGATVAVTSGNGTITTADATNPRIDLVSVSEAGTKTVTAGTAAASPKAPDLPSGNVALAMVYVPANDTTIASNQITDKRVILSPRSTVQGFIGAKAYNSAVQSINSATNTALTFDSEEYDTDGFHSTSSNTSRFTIPAGLGGKYLLCGGTYFTGNATGIRFMHFRKNGSADSIRGEERDLASINVSHTFTPVVMVDLAAGDYVELYAYQDSGGALDVGFGSTSTAQSWMAIVKLDSGKVGSGIGVAAYKAANLAMSTSGEAALTMDTDLIDTDGFHSTSTNNERFTVPAGLGGKYVVGFNGRVDGSANAYIVARKNGSTILLLYNSVWNSSNSFGSISASTVVDLAAGDYVEFKQLANSAQNLVASGGPQAWAWMMRLDSGTSAYTGSGWGSGTAFPSGPATNDRFTRTDRTSERDFYWNGTIWIPLGLPIEDAPPTTTGTYDEEFLGTADTLPSNWAWTSAPSGSDEWTLNSRWPSMLTVEGTANTDYTLSRTSFTAASTFGIWAKVHSSYLTTEKNNLRLYVYNSGSTEGRATEWYAGSQPAVRALKTVSSVESQTGATFNMSHGDHWLYIGITRDGSNNFAHWFSKDGMGWSQVTVESHTITIDRFVFKMKTYSVRSFQAIEWVRYRTDNLFPRP